MRYNYCNLVSDPTFYSSFKIYHTGGISLNTQPGLRCLGFHLIYSQSMVGRGWLQWLLGRILSSFLDSVGEEVYDQWAAFPWHVRQKQCQQSMYILAPYHGLKQSISWRCISETQSQICFIWPELTFKVSKTSHYNLALFLFFHILLKNWNIQ